MSERKPPLLLGTVTEWGIIEAVHYCNGERIYFMISKDGVVSLMPAETVEDAYDYPVCPKCRTVMVERVSTMLGGDALPYYCPLFPDKCRIKELEAENAHLRQVEITKDGIESRQASRIKELEAQLDEADAELIWFHSREAGAGTSLTMEAAQSLASERGAQVHLLAQALTTAKEAMDERRGYAAGWEWKYGPAWDEEDAVVSSALASTADAAAKVRREILEEPIRIMDEAMGLLAWYKTATGNDYNGKTQCCQEEGEAWLKKVKAILGEDAP